MLPKRTGLVVWVSDTKQAKNLERFGNIIYVSKRLNYVLLYINSADFEKKKSYIEKLNFVKRVERSFRTEINTVFPTKKYV